MSDVKGDSETELTSTMGNVLSTSTRDERNDTSDSTPTSSTDANTTASTSQIVSDDPISSTSSDVIEQIKQKVPDLSMNKSGTDKRPSVDQEADLLEMSIPNVTNEKITEDVEDLVHDLESLLGESTDSFNIPSKTAKEEMKVNSELDVLKVSGKQDILNETIPSLTEDAQSDKVEFKKENCALEVAYKENCKTLSEVVPKSEVILEATVKESGDYSVNLQITEDKLQDVQNIVEIVQGDNIQQEVIEEPTKAQVEETEASSSTLLSSNNEETKSQEEASEPLQGEVVEISEDQESKFMEEATEIVSVSENRADAIEIISVEQNESNVELILKERKVVVSVETVKEIAVESEAPEETTKDREKHINYERSSEPEIRKDVQETFTIIEECIVPTESEIAISEELTVPVECDTKEIEHVESVKIDLGEQLSVPSKCDISKIEEKIALVIPENHASECNSKKNEENVEKVEETAVVVQDIIETTRVEESSVLLPCELKVNEENLGETAPVEGYDELAVIIEESTNNDAEMTTVEIDTIAIEAETQGSIKTISDVGVKDIKSISKVILPQINTPVDVPIENYTSNEALSEETVVDLSELPSTTVIEDMAKSEDELQQSVEKETGEFPEVDIIEMSKSLEESVDIVKPENLKECFSNLNDFLEVKNPEEFVEKLDIVVESEAEKSLANVVKEKIKPSTGVTESLDCQPVQISFEASCEEQTEQVADSTEMEDSNCETTAEIIVDTFEELQLPEVCESLEDATEPVSKEETQQPVDLARDCSEAEFKKSDDVEPEVIVKITAEPSEVIEKDKSETPADSTEIVLEIDCKIAENSFEVAEKLNLQYSMDLLEEKIENNRNPVLEQREMIPQVIEATENEIELCYSREKTEDIPIEPEPLSMTNIEGTSSYIPEIIPMEILNSATEERVVEDCQTKLIEEVVSDDVEQKEEDIIVKDAPLPVIKESGIIEDSEEEMETLALEPDEENYASKPIELSEADIKHDEEALPEIGEILTKNELTEELSPTVDIEENLETILAVANLENIETPNTVERVLTEKERMEMEALRKAVESITDPSNVYEEENLTMQIMEIQNNTHGFMEEKIEIIPDSSLNVVESSDAGKEKESKPRVNEKPKRTKKSSESKMEELRINVDVPDKEKTYSPKITIKPVKMSEEEVSTTSNSESESAKGCLKMTITKQSDKMHSILKICDPEGSENIQEEEPIPKLKIKSKIQPAEQHSPKMSTRSSKQIYSPTRSSSPRITIKPVVKPDKTEIINPLKIKIGLKTDDTVKRLSPKLNIKPITRNEEEMCKEAVLSPKKVVIKPLVKPPEELEQVPSPRITIKPILKPEVDKECPVEQERSSPKIIIKPIVKPPEEETEEELKERIVLKINKGNIPTPTKEVKKKEHNPEEDKSEKLAKITLKFSREGGHPHIVQQLGDIQKRPHDEPNPEKNKKQKVEEPSIATRTRHKETLESSKNKEQEPLSESKRMKLIESPVPDLSKTPTNAKIEEDEVKVIEMKLESPIVISEDSRSQDSGSCIIIEDSKDSAMEMETRVTATTMAESTRLRSEPVVTAPLPVVSAPVVAAPVVAAQLVAASVTAPVPRKRGRPRKVPLEVRQELKDQLPEPRQEVPTPATHESGRPKRSCRGQSARDALGIKPRKPRGPGRGRGGKRGMGNRGEIERVGLLSSFMLMSKGLPEDAAKTDQDTVVKDLEAAVPKDPKIEIINLDETHEPMQRKVLKARKPSVGRRGFHDKRHSHVIGDIEDRIPCSVLVPPKSSILETNLGHIKPETALVSSEVVMVDEETRMSADTSSRAQTPAKQVVPAEMAMVEESLSSIQSSATTESGKTPSTRSNKAPRLEVQEPEGSVISADQLTEYYWNSNGPFMLQEQVAQFLGIKSFKRKYPGITRRMLDVQERDFIRESGLASEHMCDLGLTAVNSADILDIMYSDFQDKYEEYCKHQRDRQAKDMINKQKALTLAASHEKNKADITEQAVHSAAQWNANFNKARREQRKACMDLQTYTIHYPKGKIKQMNKTKIGNYPVALVPGQFTDYYKEFTPTEINNLPLSTMLYEPLNFIAPEDSDDSGSDGSDSDSDSTTSSSGSDSDSSSGVEDCKLCKSSKKSSPCK